MKPNHNLDAALGALLMSTTVGCADAGGGRDLGEPQADDRTQDAGVLAVQVARAFPAGDATVSSPFAVTIDPCQSAFHVAFEPGGAEDLSSLYGDAESPALVFSNEDDDEVRFDGGRFLLESARFDLDPWLLESMQPGVWSGEVVVGDEVVAQIPQVVKLATGDATRNGAVDSGDLVAVFTAGAYETGEAAGHDAGDFDCDGSVDSADLVAMYQAPEGVVYDGGAYVTAESPTNGETGDERRYVVSDYQCWLAAYAMPQPVMTEQPSLEGRPGEREEDRAAREQRHRERVTYSHMEASRDCSAVAHDPEQDESEVVDGVFVDPRVAGYVWAGCGYGGSMLDEASESLSEIGESYAWGEAKLTAKGNAARDVWLMCEPRYAEVAAHQTEQGYFLFDVPAMDDRDACSLELSVQTQGEVNAAAMGDWAEAPGYITSDVAVKATARSTMALYFPDLGDVSKDDGDTPAGRVIVGTASAESPGTPSPSLDNLKCEIGFFGAPTLWDPFADLQTSVNCFWEVTAADVLDFLSGGDPSPVVRDQREAHARTHLGWARPGEDGEPDYARAISDRGTLKLFPTKDGPYQKNLGKLRVYAEQEVVSSSHASHVQHEEYVIVTSVAYASQNSGAVTLSLDVPYPEPPGDYDDWTLEAQQAWHEDNYQHCRVPVASHEYEYAETNVSEPDQNGDRIVERGGSVSVGVGDFDHRYWIGRDGAVESLWDRDGAW